MSRRVNQNKKENGLISDSFQNIKNIYIFKSLANSEKCCKSGCRKKSFNIFIKRHCPDRHEFGWYSR